MASMREYEKENVLHGIENFFLFFLVKLSKKDTFTENLHIHANLMIN
jgi:hypothetical protein